jgi:glycosyltransferase involved in cell wall biosynthesis
MSGRIMPDNFKTSTGSTPLVSVVIPSYNQGMYLEKAVQSVLLQSFTDFELLISDDASPDNSWEIIQRVNDPRLRIFQQEKNLGPVGNLVFLIKESRAKYVALLNSDDYWLPGKLCKQVDIMESDSKLGACFTWADLVDDAGNIITGYEATWSDVFRQSNRTQAEWLRHFYFHGNCICHPSMLIRRDIYSHLGFYNPALRQLPDFEMWIRLVKYYPIHIIEETLVGHLRTGENTSAINHENIARNITELLEIFGDFFRDIPDELFIAAFKANFRRKDVSLTPERLRCEKLFLLLDGGFEKNAARSAAIRGFYKIFRDSRLEQILLHEYGFSVFHYHQLTGTDGFGYCWLQAMNQIKPSLYEIGQAAKHHWRDNGMYKLIKIIAHKFRLISR